MLYYILFFKNREHSLTALVKPSIFMPETWGKLPQKGLLCSIHDSPPAQNRTSFTTDWSGKARSMAIINRLAAKNGAQISTSSAGVNTQATPTLLGTHPLRVVGALTVPRRSTHLGRVATRRVLARRWFLGGMCSRYG